MRDLGHWPRYAPGACLRHLTAQRGQSIGQRNEIRAALAAIHPADHTADVTAWFPLAREVDWPPGYLQGVRATRSRPTDPVDEALVAAARTWVAGLVDADVDLGEWHVEQVDRPPGEHPRGTSGGLAVAAALIAGILGRPFREPVLTSGILGEPGEVLPVERIAAKRIVARDEAPTLTPCFATAHRDARPWLDAWLGDDWVRMLALALHATDTALAADGWSAYRQGNRPVAEGYARVAIEIGRPRREIARAWHVRGAMRLHRGETDAGVRDLDRVVALLGEAPGPEEDPPSPYEREELEAFIAIGLVDAGRPRAAIERLSRAIDRIDAEPDSRAWRATLLQLAGSLHRAHILDGDLDRAALLLDSYGLSRARLKAERARCLGDRAEVYRRAGDHAAAARCLDDAEIALADAPAASRALTLRFLHLYRARAGLAVADWPITPASWEAWPAPAETIEVLLRGAPADLAAWMEANVARQERKPHELMICLGAAARTGGTPAWAQEIGARLAEADGVEPDVAALARRAADGDVSGWEARAPY